MKKRKTPTYTIQSLHFENFKGIKHLELDNLPDNAPWILLTGENGFGKTSILQAIAASLAGLENHIIEYFKEEKLQKIRCTLHNREFFQIKHDGHLIKQESYLIQKEDEKKFFPVHLTQTNKRDITLACYGSSRLDTYTESSSEKTTHSKTSNLFDTTSLLENFKTIQK